MDRHCLTKKRANSNEQTLLFLAIGIMYIPMNGVSYIYLKTRLGMPCGKDMYYDRYRRFFWLLGNSRK